MKLIAGNMLWTNIDPIPNKYPYLSDNLECDALIIGGGITGAICAYYLSQIGINIVLVDKNILGYGSTSASTSILQYEIDTDLIGLKGLIGEENAVKSFKLCEKAVYDIQNIIHTLHDSCDFTLKECFYYTPNKHLVSYLEKEFHLRKEKGFSVSFIDEKKAKEKFSFPVKGGIYSSSGAAQINPYQFTHSLISYGMDRGLQVFENTEIININPHQDHVISYTQNKFKIKSKKVIITTGYEGRSYIKETIAHFYRTFTIVTKPVKNFEGWYNQCIIRDNNDPYTYIRNTKDNRIIIGGEDEKVGGIHSKMADLSHEDPVSTEKYNKLLKKLKSFFPHIKDIETEFEFSGIFGVTKDSLPYIGAYPDLPNCYFSLNYGSNGILYGLLGGQYIQDLYLGNYPTELELFKFRR